MTIAWDLIPPRPTTRFAPAPTGYLHLGHLVNAVFVWGIAMRLEGRVILRIEDHDRGRSRDRYREALLEDLDWLGLEPTYHGHESPERPWVMQSRRGGIYQERLAALARSSHVYGCSCTRREIQELAPARANEESRYPGTCRKRGIPLQQGAGVRVELAPGEERFHDALLGPQLQDPEAQCGDLLLRDRLGNWTYQYCVALDDMLQGVDLVVRGEDLLSSTGRQIRLGRMLGRKAPATFLHHPLVMRPDGSKLSKANHDNGLRELRRAGWTPGRLLGEAAHRSGLLASPAELTLRDLPGLFDPG